MVEFATLSPANTGSLQVPIKQGEIDWLMRAAAAALNAGDWAAAETALAGVLAEKPGDPALSYNLALVEKRLGKSGEAEQRLARVLAEAPDHLNAHFEYASALMDRGAEAEALREFESYLRAVPDDPDARLNAARLCLRSGVPEAAADHLDIAAAHRPGDPAIRLAAAEAARDLGRLEEADRSLRRLYAEVPELRATTLKVMSQGPRGRIPLAVSRLVDTKSRDV
jgi:tetratricopeptide (TPR) repeat protein